MAQLGLCRFVRSAFELSKLIPRNSRLLSTCNSGKLSGKLQLASLRPNDFAFGSKIQTRTINQLSRKAISESTASTAVQSRAASTSGDHVRLWQIERLTSATFIILLPGCIILQNPIVDALFAMLLVVHAHWGLEAVVVDYARPKVVGPVIPKLAMAALYLLSAVTLAGLFQLIYNGPGIGKTVRNFWSIGSKTSA